MFSLEQLIERVRGFRPSLDSERIRAAFDFVENLYKDRRRLSGDPYVTHFLSVLNILLPLKPDEDTVIATLLHGVLSDTDVSLDVLREKFGPKVASLLESLQTLRMMRPHPDMIDAENFRQMILALAKDLRVLLIRLADSIHNLETIEYVKDPQMQKALARECLEIYAPLASRLGIYTFKSRLEDLSFHHLHPSECAHIEDQLLKFGKQKGRFIEEIVQKLKVFLAKNSVEAGVDGRFKSVYSIYRKLKRKGRASIDDIFDVFAIRVIVPTMMSSDRESIEHIYMLLGLIHSEWTPLANRFKDYIAVAKPNGYQSLHTTVIGLSPKLFNQPVEIQIRSERMHRDAEYGVASHWLYEDTKTASTGFEKDSFLNYSAQKEKDGAVSDTRFRSQMEWLHGLSKLQEHMADGQDFADTLRLDLFNDRIFVLTPTGEVKDLPVGATPVDFAYSVHTDIGHRCSMAKVNGHLVPLDHQLKNADVVEIVLKQKPNPKPLWLSFLKTNSAKMKIRAWFHSQDRDFAFREGKELINKHLLRLGKAKLDENLMILQNYLDKNLSLRERQHVVEGVGNGSTPAYTLVRKLFHAEELVPSVPAVSRSSKAGEKLSLEEKILLGGESGLPLHLAQCCSPKESDPLIGYITRSNAATIHHADCKLLSRAQPHRILHATWKALDDATPRYQVPIFIEVLNRIGMIRDITTVISNLNINISHFGYKNKDQHDSKQNLTYSVLLDVLSMDQIDHLFNRLEQVSGVLRVYRS